MPQALILVALVLAIIDLFRSRAQSIVGWGLLCLALALSWQTLHAL